ncbi:MAG: ABC transporter substrate-binding protein [Deltaproteobacteria bacterium]|nr:ABC transporter substrate-binding protein [Deltaproteobacteria bacterium]
MGRKSRAAFVGAVCIATLATQGFAAEAVKIGVVTSATGKYAPMGQGNLTAIKLAAKLVNQQGGVLGRLVELIFHDDEGLPEKAGQLTKKLIAEEHVVAVIGSAAVVATAPIANLCDQHKVLHVFLNPQVSIWERGGKILPYSFHTVPHNSLDAQALSDYLESVLKIKRVAVFHDSNQYGTEGAAFLKEVLAKRGKVEVVAVEKFQESDRDLTASLTKMQQKNPQALVIWGGMPTAPIIAKNMRQMGMTIPIVGAQAMGSPAYIEVAQDAAEGTVFSAPLNYGEPLPEEKLLFDNYLAEYKKPPSAFAAFGWDAFMLVVEAIKRSNSTSPEKMRNALESLRGYKGAVGEYNMSPTDHNGLSASAFKLIKIQNRKWTPAPR